MSSVINPQNVAVDITTARENGSWEIRGGAKLVDSAWIRASRIVLCVLLAILPVCFGGVHPLSNSLSQLAVFLLSAVLLFSTDSGRTGRVVLAVVMTLLVYCGFQLLFHSMIALPHPLVDGTRGIYDASAFWSGFRELAFFGAAFVLSAAVLKSLGPLHSRLESFVISAGFIVAMIGLSHWFYDNGKLFWVIEPESVYISDRARWPFVNPNHLGDFLLPIAFLAFATLIVKLSALKEIVLSSAKAHSANILSIFTRRSVRSKMSGVIGIFLPLLAIGLCISATLSRGAWLGMSVGLVVFASGSLLLPRSESGRSPFSGGETHSHSNDTIDLEYHRGRRRSQGRKIVGEKIRRSSILKFFGFRFAKFLLIGGAVLVFLFFLGSRGQELVGERIEYGLLHSHEDTRWQLYTDTWALFKDHLLFGIGLGAWDAAYRSVKSPELAGLEPAYLHSDPYQILTELGVVGVLPLLLLSGLILWRIGTSLPKMSWSHGVILLGLLSGLIGLFTASLLEFPFRMPAIVLYSAVFLALITYHLDTHVVSSDGEDQ